MTARLLPALQECFKSEYVSVRIEAAMVTKFCRFTTLCDKLESRFPLFSLPLAGEPDLYVIGYYYHYHYHYYYHYHYHYHHHYHYHYHYHYYYYNYYY